MPSETKAGDAAQFVSIGLNGPRQSAGSDTAPLAGVASEQTHAHTEVAEPPAAAPDDVAAGGAAPQVIKTDVEAEAESEVTADAKDGAHASQTQQEASQLRCHR